MRNNKLNNVKNAVKNGTFTERNNYLLKLIMNTKKIYLEKLEQADTSEAVLQLESRFCFANRLKKYEQFIEYQKNALNDELSVYNKFTSIDEVVNEFYEIKNKILEDEEALLLLITYQNYKGGINNLCVVSEDFRGNTFSGIIGKSAIDEQLKILKETIANIKG